MRRGRVARMTFIDTKRTTRSGRSSKYGFGIANHLLSEVNPTAHQNPLDQAECPVL
jgi:hypothetical protein